jgi:hypothetical protein
MNFDAKMGNSPDVRRHHAAKTRSYVNDHILRRFLAAALLSVGVAAALCGPAVGLARADQGDPPPPPPPHPFRTPRGGLFIVGPICDEIGV